MKKLIFTLLVLSSGSMLAQMPGAGGGGVYNCDMSYGYLSGLMRAKAMTSDELADAIASQENEYDSQCSTK